MQGSLEPPSFINKSILKLLITSISQVISQIVLIILVIDDGHILGMDMLHSNLDPLFLVLTLVKHLSIQELLLMVQVDPLRCLIDLLVIR